MRTVDLAHRRGRRLVGGVDGTQALEEVFETTLLGRELRFLHVKHGESRLDRLENVVSPCMQEHCVPSCAASLTY